MNTILDLLKGRNVGSHVTLLICTAWLTWQVQGVKANLDARISEAWTIHMQAMRDTLVARNNPTNWIPDPWSIYWAVRQNKEASALQIKP